MNQMSSFFQQGSSIGDPKPSLPYIGTMARDVRGVSERWEGEVGGAHTAPCRAALLAPDDGVTLSTPRGDHRRSQDGRDPYGSSSPTPACTEDLPKPQAVR